MKKLILALLLPLSTMGLTLEHRWEPYPVTATIHNECRYQGQPTFVENVQGPSSDGKVVFDYPVDPGQTIECRLWATSGSEVSPRSGVAAYTRPLALPAPVSLGVH